MNKRELSRRVKETARRAVVESLYDAECFGDVTIQQARQLAEMVASEVGKTLDECNDFLNAN
jgi:hypothetical protein